MKRRLDDEGPAWAGERESRSQARRIAGRVNDDVELPGE